MFDGAATGREYGIAAAFKPDGTAGTFEQDATASVCWPPSLRNWVTHREDKE
jgi:hypothetical protein